MGVSEQPTIENDTYPEDCIEADQWLTWKQTDDGRKIPRAPYLHPDWPDRFVNAQDPDVWTDFETACDWADKLPGHQLAFTIRDREEFADEDLVLVDYDDVRDPETGRIHPVVREHLEQAGGYADVSPSGTGVHVLCRGGLPEGVKTIADTLPSVDGFPDAGIEVYDSARFVAMSGGHIQGTPRETVDSQSFLDELAEEYATVVEGTPDAFLDAPEKSKEELAAIDATTDIQDVFDAIQQIGPGDIHLRSTVTEERSDGSKSLDPSWASSDSGTRLAEIDSGWIYREGMIGLDALQVVALEEGIVTDERSYPAGKDFWTAVEALRERGAHVPSYEPPSDGPAGDASPVADGTSTGGDATLGYEAELLRATVKEQRDTIEALETAIAERDTTIETQRGQLSYLEAQLEALREELAVYEDEHFETESEADGTPWDRMKGFFGRSQ